jgi:hypothetical protein
VESALRSNFPGTRGASLQTEGGKVQGSHNKTISHAIPEERFLREDQGSQREGESEDQRP